MTRAKTGNVVDNFVQKDLCSGCGICAGVCPGNYLMMSNTAGGDLVAYWSNGPCPKNCGLCLVICPFANGVLNPRQLNFELYGPDGEHTKRHFHKDVGYFEGAFVGYSERNRPTSASGGLLSWTLEALLSSDEVDRVAVVVCEPDEVHGYRFLFKEARTVAEVRQNSGSIYHQVEISGLLRRITSEPGLRWAISGVPCMCSALRKAMLLLPKLQRSVRYVFGLACGMYQNRFYTELLAMTSGLQPREAAAIRYRVKDTRGPASNYQFQAASRNGRNGKRIEYSGLPYFLGRNAFFRCNTCNFCMDVFAETADACYMDAWLPEYDADPRGTSLVLVRNSEVNALLLKGKVETHLMLDSIGIERILQSQAAQVRRKRYLIAMRLGEKLDPSTGRPFSQADRIAWFVQRYAQRRSKEAWADVGRRHGVRSFWRSLWDVSLLIRLEELYLKLQRRLFRFGSPFKEIKLHRGC